MYQAPDCMYTLCMFELILCSLHSHPVVKIDQSEAPQQVSSEEKRSQSSGMSQVQL